jgi:hypothetical protein
MKTGLETKPCRQIGFLSVEDHLKSNSARDSEFVPRQLHGRVMPERDHAAWQSELVVHFCEDN